MTQPPIFISYSRHDGEFALRLGRDLRVAGVNLWIDQLDIPPGERWDREVEQALKACRTLIVILSPEAVVSENVMDEVGYALKESKRVVPVLRRACTLPLRLQRVQYVDLSTDYEQGLQRLRTTLVTPEADSDGATAQRRATLALHTRGDRWAWGHRVGVAALVGLAFGGGFLLVNRIWRPAREESPPVAIPSAGAPLGQPLHEESTPHPPVTLPESAAVPAFMSRPLTEAELMGKSTWELDVMRNEIYARHGRRFARSDLQSYFSAQPWYRPLYAPDEFPTSLLTAVQKRNVELIQRYQQQLAQ